MSVYFIYFLQLFIILIDYVQLTFMTLSALCNYRVLQKLLNELSFLYEYVLNETFNQSLTDFNQSITKLFTGFI